MIDLIPDLTARGIVVSIGHTEATYEQASAAVAAGATMITHLFNAMKSLHHRNPGVFGLLGTASPNFVKPYFGMIADGIHVHPTAVKLAYNAHPEGFILVTDAMHLTGLPDGPYPWTNGDVASTIVKRGSVLCLEGTEKIAGRYVSSYLAKEKVIQDLTGSNSSITLVECVNNFLSWSGGEGIAKALKTVTATPARMLGVEGRKGQLTESSDADLVIFSEENGDNGTTKLVVDEVWKYGKRVHRREGADISPPTSPLREIKATYTSFR
jgi:N-acetylglucosamine-6-phosphate deacetylase